MQATGGFTNRLSKNLGRQILEGGKFRASKITTNIFLQIRRPGFGVTFNIFYLIYDPFPFTKFHWYRRSGKTQIALVLVANV